MIRTQVQLTDEQMRRLRRAAERENVSVAEIVRRCVDLALDGQRPERAESWRRARTLAGKFQDREGARDVATRHDEHLDEAFR
jgi:hypothetical protein